MSIVLDGVVVRHDGGIEGTLTGPATSFSAGQGYVSGKVFFATASSTATDGVVSGFRYADGALRIFDAEAGLPDGVSYNAGIAMSPDGRACYIGTASASGNNFLSGLCVDALGRLFINLS